MTFADLKNINLDKISKLPLPQKLLILGGIVVVIFAFYFYFLHIPKTKELKVFKQNLVKLEAERDQKKATADNLPRFKKEIDKLNKQLEAALIKLPTQAEIDQLLIDIPVRAGESGLEIESFKPIGEVSRDFYAEVPIQLEVSGRYLDIATFLDKLAGLERIVHVGNVTLKPEKQMGREVVLNSKMNVTTYRFLEKSLEKQGEPEKKGTARKKGRKEE